MSQPYPAVRFVVNHGLHLAWALPVLVLIAGFGALLLGLGAWVVACAAVIAVVLFGLLRLMVELVQIIAETLLPQ